RPRRRHIRGRRARDRRVLRYADLRPWPARSWLCQTVGDRTAAVRGRAARHALVGFGDGPVETIATRAAGGLPVGVALDEAHGTALDPAKRTALIAAGAGIIIPHFGEHARLVELIFDSDKLIR
ncbi:MAG TPA: hypothetical protein VF909_07225, partial [Roseiflexaceae bacterium]